MNSQLILTVICDDKPGIVEQLAQTISNHQGNWLESRMSHLAGKFAGILQVAVNEIHKASLRQALTDLHSKGFKIIVEDALSVTPSDCRQFSFTVVGADRPGIVREIAQAFSVRHINMGELETACSSMPWSGEPLFEASGIIEVPKSVNLNDLYDQLDKIADDLAIDIRLESSSEQSV
ncbi:glycine cleavage system protein R [Cellvibrio japonicus]|uniref:Glycine cleavage system transcriptional repressor n=1 Tax=Cellvibrio japonicus (strain Ueda107) TaxID=498211 RepID=B3PKB5_CELJU|nr:ACT domain-containing protein [Cellvibrio japonicus]ACE84457.1 ACT domain protein [Cellvibrio japonicus Ueda107]QEI12788.1 cellulose-binding protein [Cellvibrio japonicus]QEI16362.1 cellulose-binding protein [Cellvibrio japonicus]QEI19940.1 cellulose-binding protein [Cellvibrio japonicus]